MLGKFFQKPAPELQDRVPPGQHLAKGFPVLTYGDTPTVDREHWQLRVWGLATEVAFGWDDIMAMPQSSFTADFHCVTTWSKLDVQWVGIKVTDFMRHVELDPKAVHLMEHCYGGYTTNIAIDDFLREENFFAHTLLVNRFRLITVGRCVSSCPTSMPGKARSGSTGWNFSTTKRWASGNAMVTTVVANPGPKNAIATRSCWLVLSC